MKQVTLEEAVRDTYPHGHTRFIPELLALASLHSRKNADYAGGKDPLSNFIRVGEMLERYGVEPHTPSAVALIYMLKQLDAVMSSVGEGRELKVDSIGERLQDIAVYAILAKIMLEEGK